ncbi:MAG: hypothetical protein KAJ03_07120, partial [Gammaproteobacteria bacterium]|nr:hypothetical protein [Gammaproteobacteria bacterium]
IQRIKDRQNRYANISRTGITWKSGVGNALDTLLVGERAVGNIAYGLRLKLGGSELDYAKNKTYYGAYDVSLSEAIGLSQRNNRLQLRDVAGFALDVVTDPTTYLFGVGLAGKAGKAGKLARGAKTVSQIEDLAYGGKVTAAMLASTDVIKPTKYLAFGTQKSNIPLIRYSTLGAPITRPLRFLHEALPGTSGRVEVGAQLRGFFDKFYGMTQGLSLGEAAFVRGRYKQMGTAAGAGIRKEELLIQNAAKLSPRGAGRELTYALESGTAVRSSLARAHGLFSGFTSEWGESYVSMGLLTSEQLKRNYVPHVPGKDFHRALRTKPGLAARYYDKSSALKMRAIDDTIENINAQFGMEFFEPDAFKIFGRASVQYNEFAQMFRFKESLFDVLGKLPEGVSFDTYRTSAAITAKAAIPKLGAKTDDVRRRIIRAGSAREKTLGESFRLGGLKSLDRLSRATRELEQFNPVLSSDINKYTLGLAPFTRLSADLRKSTVSRGAFDDLRRAVQSS